MDDKNFNLNETKLVKTILNMLLKVDRRKFHKLPELDESAYDESTLQYLIPTDYEINNSSAYFIDNNVSTNETGSTSSLMTQLSTPILYIVFMMFIYALIILIVFISAIYSHRKRIGYTYDEDLSDDCDSSSCESSDEIANFNSVKYSKLLNNDQDEYKQLKETINTNDIECNSDELKSDITSETTTNTQNNEIKFKRMKNFQMKRINEQLKTRFIRSKCLNQQRSDDRRRLVKYLSIKNGYSFKQSVNYLRNMIKTSRNISNYTKFKANNTENMIELNANITNEYKSNEKRSPILNEEN